MKTIGHESFQSFIISPDWIQVLSQHNLSEYERAIQGYLSGIDCKEDPYNYYLGLLEMFRIYVTHHEKTKAHEVLNRLDQIELPNDLNHAKQIAEQLFDEFGEIDSAEKYMLKALQIPHNNPNYQLAVLSLALAIAVVRDPYSVQVQELLLEMHRPIHSRQFYHRHLMQAMKTLVPLSLVPWWGRFLLEAMWSELSVREKFYSRKEQQSLKEIAALYSLLPQMPVSRADTNCDDDLIE